MHFTSFLLLPMSTANVDTRVLLRSGFTPANDTQFRQFVSTRVFDLVRHIPRASKTSTSTCPRSQGPDTDGTLGAYIYTHARYRKHKPSLNNSVARLSEAPKFPLHIHKRSRSPVWFCLNVRWEKLGKKLSAFGPVGALHHHLGRMPGGRTNGQMGR